MNSYVQILAGAVEELHKFAVTDEGRKWDKEWYDQAISLIGRIQAQSTDSEAEHHLDTLMFLIADSGPLGLSPSIGRAADAMQRKRKKL